MFGAAQPALGPRHEFGRSDLARGLPCPISTRIMQLTTLEPAPPKKKMAAFRDARAVGTRESGVQVRAAGPEAMRDRPRRNWSSTDEAIDESFPASDPPAA